MFAVFVARKSVLNCVYFKIIYLSFLVGRTPEDRSEECLLVWKRRQRPKRTRFGGCKRPKRSSKTVEGTGRGRWREETIQQFIVFICRNGGNNRRVFGQQPMWLIKAGRAWAREETTAKSKIRIEPYYLEHFKIPKTSMRSKISLR